VPWLLASRLRLRLSAKLTVAGSSANSIFDGLFCLLLLAPRFFVFFFAFKLQWFWWWFAGQAGFPAHLTRFVTPMCPTTPRLPSSGATILSTLRRLPTYVTRLFTVQQRHRCHKTQTHQLGLELHHQAAVPLPSAQHF
jgi:hypothetical protein